MRRPRALAAALIASVGLAACGSGEQETAAAPTEVSPTPPETTASPAPAPTSAPTPTGPDASPHEGLGFTAETVDGGTLDAAALQGDVVLWFWAPW